MWWGWRERAGLLRAEGQRAAGGAPREGAGKRLAAFKACNGSNGWNSCNGSNGSNGPNGSNGRSSSRAPPSRSLCCPLSARGASARAAGPRRAPSIGPYITAACWLPGPNLGVLKQVHQIVN